MFRQLIVTLTVFSLILAPTAHATVAVADAPMLCEIITPIKNLISIAIAAGGVAFFIMLIWGSVTWLTAGENANQAGQAQSTITWAVIGLVLLVASYAILMIIQSFTGVTLTEIKFPWIENRGVTAPPRCQ